MYIKSKNGTLHSLTDQFLFTQRVKFPIPVLALELQSFPG